MGWENGDHAIPNGLALVIAPVGVDDDSGRGRTGDPYWEVGGLSIWESGGLCGCEEFA